MGLDPTTFSVLRKSFTSIATEMGITLAKVAYSPIITEALDFSGAVFDRDGHLVACGRRDLTGLLGTLEPSVQFILERFGDGALDPGDVILTGTPAGIGAASDPPRWLHEGDVVDVEIDGVGRLRNYVRQE